MTFDLAAELTKVIADATPAAPQPTIQGEFATLLHGTTPTPPRRYRIRCVITDAVIAFAGCVEAARDAASTWNERAHRGRYEVEFA